MARKEHSYHYIYKTTNLINNNFYIGMHSTSNLDDGYLGSGKRLRYSIRKYGKENFKKEILEFLPNRKLLSDRERELINEELINETLCMNLVYGGDGGFISEEGYKKGAKKMLEIIWNDPEFKKRSSERMKKTSNRLWENQEHREKTLKRLLNSHLGVKRSIDIIEKTKVTFQKIGHQKGEKNSHFGTCWITNGIENKIIKKTDFYLYESEWKLGRSKIGNVGKNQYSK